ncbi:hypothetical protein HQ544_03050 [Candidatus Falkowbacteria bacterium]|nr:hypothetical protein [Candidatus Falkowbacteria bacterium]
MPKIEEGSKEKSPTFDEPKMRPKNKKSPRGLLILIIVVVVIVVAGFLITKVTGIGPSFSASSGDWQATFLINGQVYFGHVVKETKDSVVLRDIYYLRVTEPLQQGEEATEKSNELSLIKLGNELHGPEDEMRIVRNNILFIEDLKPDSKVSIAIEEYIADQQED